MCQTNLKIYLKIITRNEEKGPEIRPNAMVVKKSVVERFTYICRERYSGWTGFRRFVPTSWCSSRQKQHELSVAALPMFYYICIRLQASLRGCIYSKTPCTLCKAFVSFCSGDSDRKPTLRALAISIKFITFVYQIVTSLSFYLDFMKF